MYQEFTGIEYIKIAIANAYGYDKLTWDKRLEWFDFTVTHGIDYFLKNAAEPLLMQKALNAYRDAIAGTPTGYIMGLDATASGIQILSALIGCEKGAAHTNLIDTGKREDAYKNVTAAMNKLVTIDVSRRVMKNSVMTVMYGSKAEPKKAFGEDTPELDAFYATIQEEFPGACEAMNDIQSCWQGDALVHSWVMPDGHTVHVPVTEMVDKKIEVDELDHATFTHRAKVNTSQEYGVSLAANATHACDSYLVREMYRRADSQGFEILTIHK